MQKLIQQDIILYDWLSFTCRDYHDPYALLEDLGLSDLSFKLIKGAHGYRDRLYFDGLSVHYNGSSDQGIWFEASGQGCRNIESFGTKSIDQLIDLARERSWHLTRLDIAFDDYSGFFDVEHIAGKVYRQEYISKSRWWEVVRSSAGTSCYLGSPQSLWRIRFYDKAAERHCDPGTHWIRCEVQLRDERAQAFTDLVGCVNGPGIGFRAMVSGMVRFVDPPEDPDSNKSRWPTSPWWSEFLCCVLGVSLWSSPGTEYNLDRCKSYVFGQAGNAVQALIDVYGTEGFALHVADRQCQDNPKYDIVRAEGAAIADQLARDDSFFDLVRKVKRFEKA